MYKFISIFGLDILLFSFYKSSDVFDPSADSQKAIKYLKTEFYYPLYLEHNKLQTDAIDLAIRKSSIKKPSSDLNEIELALEKLILEQKVKIDFESKIRKLKWVY